jgi:hypothetical protein
MLGRLLLLLSIDLPQPGSIYCLYIQRSDSIEILYSMKLSLFYLEMLCNVIQHECVCIQFSPLRLESMYIHTSMICLEFPIKFDHVRPI